MKTSAFFLLLCAASFYGESVHGLGLRYYPRDDESRHFLLSEDDASSSRSRRSANDRADREHLPDTTWKGKFEGLKDKISGVFKNAGHLGNKVSRLTDFKKKAIRNRMKQQTKTVHPRKTYKSFIQLRRPNKKSDREPLLDGAEQAYETEVDAISNLAERIAEKATGVEDIVGLAKQKRKAELENLVQHFLSVGYDDDTVASLADISIEEVQNIKNEIAAGGAPES